MKTSEAFLLSSTNSAKSVQIRTFFWSVFSPNARKYGPEKTPYLDTFEVVNLSQSLYRVPHHQRIHTGILSLDSFL